jgi:hypothetical protein
LIASRRRAFDFSLLSEYSEDAIKERVLALTDADLSIPKSTLISHLQNDFAVQMPKIAWNEAKVMQSQIHDSCWELKLVAPMRDVSCVAWSIEWPSTQEVAFEPDPEGNSLTVRQRCSGNDAAAARSVFEGCIADFQANFDEAAKDVERFNVAVPYLVSMWLEARLHDLPEARQGGAEASSSNAVGRMLDKMVADGQLTAVFAFDAAAGRLRQRYFASGRSRSSGDASSD